MSCFLFTCICQLLLIAVCAVLLLISFGLTYGMRVGLHMMLFSPHIDNRMIGVSTELAMSSIASDSWILVPWASSPIIPEEQAVFTLQNYGPHGLELFGRPAAFDRWAYKRASHEPLEKNVRALNLISVSWWCVAYLIRSMWWYSK